MIKPRASFVKKGIECPPNERATERVEKKTREINFKSDHENLERIQAVYYNTQREALVPLYVGFIAKILHKQK